MKLLYGEIVEVFEEQGMHMGRIRVGGALKNIALDVVADAAVGDVVLVCDGMAISKVKEEADNVSGHTG